MSTKASDGTKTSSERARAWLVTVINPLLGALELEEGYLSRERWTWRFHLEECELLQPCRTMVPSMYSENFDDMLRKRPDLTEVVRGHDAALGALLAELLAAQKALEADGAFQNVVRTLLDEHRTAEASDEPWGAFAPEKIVPLTAQYVLNGITESYQGETMFRFWNRHGERFRAEFASYAERIEPHGARLLQQVQALRQALTALKYALCDEHDLPPVPLSQVPFPERF